MRYWVSTPAVAQAEPLSTGSAPWQTHVSGPTNGTHETGSAVKDCRSLSADALISVDPCARVAHQWADGCRGSVVGLARTRVPRRSHTVRPTDD
jgi:hypothetical protein